MTVLRKYGPMLTLLATALLMTGCGIKPNKLDAPPGSDASSFPKTYPAQE